jgi:hypothetical protein
MDLGDKLLLLQLRSLLQLRYHGNGRRRFRRAGLGESIP